MTSRPQEAVDRCDFIDVLEESVTLKSPVSVMLHDGRSFIDQVVDVVTEKGEDFAEFQANARIPVSQLQSVRRATH